jgi:hypothetical protein
VLHHEPSEQPGEGHVRAQKQLLQIQQRQQPTLKVVSTRSIWVC